MRPAMQNGMSMVVYEGNPKHHDWFDLSHVSRMRVRFQLCPGESRLDVEGKLFEDSSCIVVQTISLSSSGGDPWGPVCYHDIDVTEFSAARLRYLPEEEL